METTEDEAGTTAASGGDEVNAVEDAKDSAGENEISVDTHDDIGDGNEKEAQQPLQPADNDDGKSSDSGDSDPPGIPFTDPDTGEGQQTPRSGADTPRYSSNVMLTPQRSPITQHEVDPEDDSDIDCDHNPEAPSEFSNDLMQADTIGETVFSKHWLFSTLMKLIQAVDGHTEGKDSAGDGTGDGTGDGGLDLEESLQDELCKLWDMSMNSDIVKFLQEFKAIEILTGVIAKSKAPRATEICVGILGNMACTESAVQEISASTKLVSLALLLLSDSDAPTLVEVMRLLRTCVSSVTGTVWKSAIKEEGTVYERAQFILSSSTNSDLLHNTAEFVDKVMDLDEEVCVSWSTVEMAQAVLEATRQCGTAHASETLDSLFHILQLMSTVESGVEVLVSQAEAVLSFLHDYLTNMCADEIVGVDGRENSFASAFSIFSVILASWDKSTQHLEQDFQAVRCLLKVLEVVYPKRHRVRVRRRHRRPHRRRRTTSDGTRSPTARRRFISNNASAVASLDANVSINITIDERMLDTELKTDEDVSDQTAEKDEDTVEKKSVQNETDLTDQTVEQNEAEPDHIDNNNDPENRQRKRHHSSSDSDSDRNTSSDDHSEDDETSDDSGMKMLEEVLQQFAVDVLLALVKVPLPDADSDQWFVPKTLKYLDTMCSRDRLYILVWTLEDVASQPDPAYVQLLQTLAESFDQRRLARIIQDAL